MKNKHKSDDLQLSLFDLINAKNNVLANISSDDINTLMNKLSKAKRSAKKREQYELECERKERLRKEQEERERKAKEEQEKHQAHIREVTCMDLPLDWENVFNSDFRAQGVHFESIPDALVHCLETLGRVDIEYISSVTGEDYKTVICSLKGAIYQNPDTWDECFYKGWETSDEYLSGNLMRKLKSARSANEEYNGYFSENITALEKALPPTVAAEDIYITLGSPWVPADVIDEFMEYLFGDPLRFFYYNNNNKQQLVDSLKTIHDEITGTWEIPCKSRYNHSPNVKSVYGTSKLEALYILERTLNMKTVSVTDEVSCPANSSGTKRIINKAETVAVIEKQRLMIDKFQKWVWTDAARKERLTAIFEEKYGCVKKRTFDGSFLTFPTLSPDVQLYPYQKDAVARIIFTPNTLLAHDVGAGKTYAMIAAGQELRRIGLSKKNMYVVPNNIVGQWKSIFLQMYPQADLLCVEPKSFTPKKRELVLEDIRDYNYDGIIIAYSCFEQIPLSKSYYINELKEEQEQISELLKEKKRVTSGLERKAEAIKNELLKLELEPEDSFHETYFDQLGITRLFVDEAHNFKNVPISTRVNKVLGISAGGSKRCRHMMDKVHAVQKMNNGKGVVFATGTPITNSVTDAYIMQMYLQSGELAMLDLQHFDSWLGMFAEKTTNFEIDVDTSTYRLATRFAKFHNLPELTSLLSSVADFHGADESANIPQTDGYSDTLISKTPSFAAYLDDISQRADAVRSGNVDRKEDNMLKITTDGRKAALDMRLVDPSIPFTYQSKVASCAENAADIYFKTTANKSAQLIFCDTSTPKAGFNIYDELKHRLTLLGVPADQIAFIHDADTEARRSALFAKVRAGIIRILVGSSSKLGLGVNVQDKLIALHHIDVPWRPADMTQREGRILRQGNENPKVKIFRYITEGSFDAYSWQLLETKQRFITDLLSGSLNERSGADIDDIVLNYAEVKALAVGNPLIKKRVEIANELTRYITLQRKLVDTRTRLEKEISELPARQEHRRNLIKLCEDDAEFYKVRQELQPAVIDSNAKKQQAEQRKAIRDRINEALQDNVLQTHETVLMNYRGFDIVLPSNMILQKPYIWLQRSSRYYVELGGTSTGNLIRIENFLDSLSEHLEKLKHELKKLEEKEAQANTALADKESYADDIESCRKKLEKIDKELKVDKK